WSGSPTTRRTSRALARALGPPRPPAGLGDFAQVRARGRASHPTTHLLKSIARSFPRCGTTTSGTARGWHAFRLRLQMGLGISPVPGIFLLDITPEDAVSFCVRTLR